MLLIANDREGLFSVCDCCKNTLEFRGNGIGWLSKTCPYPDDSALWACIQLHQWHTVAAAAAESDTYMHVCV